VTDQPTVQNVGAWDELYADLDPNRPFLYGDPVTYRMAGEWFAEIGPGALIEDWGCGGGALRPFVRADQQYRGIDGSHTPHADIVTDLAAYQSDATCILLRHVLEHSYEWETILDNAVKSFSRRLCVVLFTPLVERTEVLMTEPDFRDVPVIAFRIEDLLDRLEPGMDAKVERVEGTRCAYDAEHIVRIVRL